MGGGGVLGVLGILGDEDDVCESLMPFLSLQPVNNIKTKITNEKGMKRFFITTSLICNKLLFNILK